MSESAATIIYLPCDVIPVRARLSVGDGLSPIEKIVLRAIEARPCISGDLSELLGLGDRVTIDILHGLWRYGYLRIDFATRKIDVSAEIRRQINAGMLDTVAGIDSEEIQQELMIDKITGHVMPCRGPKAPPLPRLAVDHMRADITLEGASQTAIAAALNRTIETAERRRELGPAYTENLMGQRVSRAGTGRVRRVRSILAMPRELRAASGRRWLAVEVHPAINPDTERLVITVTDRQLPAERRELASQLLTQLAADFPQDGFVAELRKAAGPKLLEPPPLRDAIARLASDARRTAGIPAGQRIARHRELCDSARQIEALLSNWISAEVNAEVLLAGEHLQRIDDLINQAERQLVLVSPRVTYEAVSRMEAQLRKKIRSGVRVVMLWGSDYDDEIEEGRAANIVSSLWRERGGSSMLLPLTSARTRARLVIADDRAALVTSHNILSSGRGGHDIGVLVRPANGEQSQAIRDLLERVRLLVPDAKMSRQLAVHAEEFISDGKTTPVASPAPGTLPEAPPDDPDDDPGVPGAVAAWTAAWTGFAQNISAMLDARTATVATPVADDDHRELLWRALRNAKRRLVIASERLNAEVCNQRFRQAISDCLTRGVRVTIIFQGAVSGPDGAGAISELKRLAAGHPGRFHLHERKTSAKILIWDDDAVVGSFDYLSRAGYAVRASYLQQSELSIRLTGAELAARLAQAAGEPADTAALPSPAILDSLPPATPAIPTAAGAAQRIRNRVLTGAQLGALLNAELGACDDPWAVLEALAMESGADDVVTAAAAHCILRYPDRAPPQLLNSWQRRLILACWDSGRFTEAAVLRCAYADESFRPRRWLAVLAAVRRTTQYELALIAAGDIPLLDCERPVLLAVATTELLRTGSEYAANLVSEAAADTAGVWAELAVTALGYCKHARGLSPRHVLRTAAAPALRATERSVAWAALDQVLARGRQVPVNNSPGMKTHYALFGKGGVFGQISEATPRRDTDAIRDAVLAAHADAPGGDTDKVVGAIVDRTWARVAPNANPLQGKRRGRYLDRLADILQAAEALLESGPEKESAPVHGSQPDDAARELAGRLAGLCADVGRAVAELPVPERRLAEAALADLNGLVSLEQQ
jgi:phosphatidylserine/phosphatidylglycerophosphate/cardiolipin synthase-like enzyme